MSPESDNREEMRPEYDIRGGTRGKYFQRYQSQAATRIVFQESALVLTSTCGAAQVSGFTWSASYPAPYPSPTIQLGVLEQAASAQ